MADPTLQQLYVDVRDCVTLGATLENWRGLVLAVHQMNGELQTARNELAALRNELATSRNELNALRNELGNHKHPSLTVDQLVVTSPLGRHLRMSHAPDGTFWISQEGEGGENAAWFCKDNGKWRWFSEFRWGCCHSG